MEKEGLPGLPAARALSALQDTIIQVIYDFAVKHVYYAQNPSSAERIAVVATGGYGRGELAPGSDIDLLFLRPFKQTAWGESVIEFILYMLWDLGLKVGHATRSRWRNACAWPSRTSPSAPRILEARYLWGDQGAVRRAAQEILERGRHRQWPRFRRSQAGRAQRAPCSARAKAAIWSSPISRKARAACATCRRSIGSASISIMSMTPPTWSIMASSPARNTAPSRRRKPFCGMCGCICII